MTDGELVVLLQATMAAQYEADSFSADPPTRATAHPPATSEEIASLERHLRQRGLVLPASLAQLLRVHNGIEQFLPSINLSLRSAQDMEAAWPRDEVWCSISPACRFVFASGDTAAFAGFVPDAVDERGEMRVVLVNEFAETTEYDDLDAFLQDQLEYYQSVIRAERADREGLPDD